jgi:transposase
LQPSLIRPHCSAGHVAALVSMPQQTRSAAQTRHLAAFLRFCPKAHQLRQFVSEFRAMLRWRNANKLCIWIEAATASHFRFLAQFANTLRRDLKAVELSITTPWSNGPIEEYINRLKAIKRQMYGRPGSNCSKRECCPGMSRKKLDLCTESAQEPFRTVGTVQTLSGQ